jgi:hypothetical protein
MVRTGKHGDFIDIVELAKVFAVEAGPEVCNEDLGALVQSDSSSVEDCFVAETVKVLGEEVDEAGGRVLGAVDAVGKATSELLERFSQHKVNRYKVGLECLHCRERHQPRASTVLAL